MKISVFNLLAPSVGVINLIGDYSVASMDREGERLELEYQEVSNQIERQISEIEKHRRQAALFLRITVASIGLIIALSQPINQIDTITRILVEVDPQGIAESLASTENGTERILGETVAILITASVWGSGILAVYHFVRLSISSYNAARPSEIAIGSRAHETGEIYGMDPVRRFSETIREYQEAINHNNGVLENARKHLNNAFIHARSGILATVACIASFLAMRYQNPLVSYTALFIVGSAAIFISNSEHDYSELEEYILPELTIIVFVIPTSIFTVVDILIGESLLIIVGWIIAIIAPIVYNMSVGGHTYFNGFQSAVLTFSLIAPVFLGEVVGAEWLSIGPVAMILGMTSFGSFFALTGVVIAIIANETAIFVESKYKSMSSIL